MAYFLKNHRPPEFTIRLADAIKLYRDSKERDGLRARSLQGIAWTLEAFTTATDNPQVHEEQDANVSKTRHERQILISDNLAAWLEAFQGPVIPADFERLNKRVRKHFKLSHDEARHSFISYHVALQRPQRAADQDCGQLPRPRRAPPGRVRRPHPLSRLLGGFWADTLGVPLEKVIAEAKLWTATNSLTTPLNLELRQILKMN